SSHSGPDKLLFMPDWMLLAPSATHGVLFFRVALYPFARDFSRFLDMRGIPFPLRSVTLAAIIRGPIADIFRAIFHCPESIAAAWLLSHSSCSSLLMSSNFFSAGWVAM